PGVAALHAGVAQVRTALGRGRDLDQLALLGARHDLAADAAVAAHRLRPLGRPPLLEHAAVEDGAGRAHVGAGAARDAPALEHAGPAGVPPGAPAALSHLPPRFALDLVAHPHAAHAGDALVHVHVQVGVRVVHQARVGHVAVRGHAVLVQE